MANFEDGSYSSMPGIALIAKILAGRCLMKYTRAAVGKGYIPDGMSPKTMTEPADYVMDAKIASVTTPVDGECQVTVQINSSDVETGFYATGVLLYAEDPDEKEVPYTYLVLENGPEWIRPASSIVGKLATFDLIAAVGDVDYVTAIINPEAIATVGHVKQMCADHDSDPNAHSGLFRTLHINIPATGWREAEESSPDHNWICDVAVADVTSSHIPQGAVLVGGFHIAQKAGVVQACETLNGSIRFFSKRVPEDDIRACINLFDVGRTTIIPPDADDGGDEPTVDDTPDGYTVSETGAVVDMIGNIFGS